MTRRLALAGGAVAVAVALLTSACSDGDGSGSGAGGDAVRVLTHRDVPLPPDIQTRFEEATGGSVSIIVEDDVEAVLALLESNDEPWRIADVVLGVDSLAVTRALPLVEPFVPTGVDRLDQRLRLDGDALTPLAAIDVCVNYDRAMFTGGDAATPAGGAVPGLDALPDAAGDPATGEAGTAEGEGQEGDGQDDEAATGEATPAEATGDEATGDEGSAAPVTPPPASLLDLTSGAYAQQLALPDPATDRFGAWFLAATHARLASGPDDSRWLAFIGDLRRNGYTVTPTWRDAYFGRFTAGNDRGDRPLVVASALMPAVTTRYWLSSFQGPDLPLVADTGVVTDSCAGIVEYGGVVAGTPRRRLAGRFMDLLVAPESQIIMYDDHGSRPARTDLVIPPEVDRYGIDVDAPLVDPAEAAAGLESWLVAWDAAAALEQTGAADQPAVDGDTGDTTAGDGDASTEDGT